jgi:septin family protein
MSAQPEDPSPVATAKHAHFRYTPAAPTQFGREPVSRAVSTPAKGAPRLSPVAIVDAAGSRCAGAFADKSPAMDRTKGRTGHVRAAAAAVETEVAAATAAAAGGKAGAGHVRSLVPAADANPRAAGNLPAAGPGSDKEDAEADNVSTSTVSPAASGMEKRRSVAVSPIVVSAEELVANVKESLVAQRRRALERKGERLTIMCIGEAGSGKTTLAQSLFVQPIPRRSIGTKSTVEIEESVVEMVMGQGEATVRVHLRIVDSPGYGDDIDVESSFKRVSDYIEDGFERVMASEKRAVRPDYEELDGSVGVDAVLYFVAPHRLKRLDIEFLKRIHRRASVLPVISKADTMTVDELAAFRAEVKDGLCAAGIDTFADPFAVICCAVSAAEAGEVSYSRGREYPWGTALSDDPSHSDLPLLRQTLLTDGLLDLHEARRAKFEAYRREAALKQRQRRRGVFGRLRRLQRWALGIAMHTVMGMAVIKGVQMRLEAGGDGDGGDGDVGNKLVRERGRGFFGSRRAPEPLEPAAGRWGRRR